MHRSSKLLNKINRNNLLSDWVVTRVLLVDVSEQIFTIELVFVIVLATALDVAEVVVEDQHWIGSRHQHVDPHGELAVLQEQRVPDQLKPSEVNDWSFLMWHRRYLVVMSHDSWFTGSNYHQGGWQSLLIVYQVFFGGGQIGSEIVHCGRS